MALHRNDEYCSLVGCDQLIRSTWEIGCCVDRDVSVECGVGKSGMCRLGNAVWSIWIRL